MQPSNKKSQTPSPRQLDPETLKHLERTREKRASAVKQYSDPIRRAAQLSEEDLAVRINARG